MKYIFQGSIIILVKVNYVSLFLDVRGGICPQKSLVSFQRFSYQKKKKMLGLKKKMCDIYSVSPIGINRKRTLGPELPDRNVD